ncbi:TetR/AcrR family transcriptional regulator [Microlunatus elymi]|uniref:TetR/AcrR family transcriptional regulator n=1 Tax=Microlunatus elymi TaxID=2596828 RepID=A0A516PX53_9ACTN|nr:TetR family transcriptional regulator [Microlunatus elymi]QDP95765.1 TetR/AcrR family transcriptional regulator [Microlunatus elymi]
MPSFQRAHSEEQRAARRSAILQTAAVMLTEMPVAALSLNELSRRVGLAKSNVLRYFPSREAILLSLLTRESAGLVAEVSEQLKRADRRRTVLRRSEIVADVFVAALADRPVLCDLLSAQAGVLERNITVEVATEFKRASIDQVRLLAEVVHRQLPELAVPDCSRLIGASLLQIGAVWTHSQPAESVQAVYHEHPDLAVFPVDFADTMYALIVTFAAGLLVRSKAI